MTLADVPTDVLWKIVRSVPSKVEFYRYDKIPDGETLNNLVIDFDEVVLELARRIPEQRRAVAAIRGALTEAEGAFSVDLNNVPVTTAKDIGGKVPWWKLGW